MRKKVQKLAVYKVDYNILVRRNWGGGDDAFLKYEQNLKIHCFNSRTIVLAILLYCDLVAVLDQLADGV